jgi:hypothetical protein
MEMLQVKYTLKKGSVGEPTAYLGAEVCKHYIENLDDPTKVRWALSSDTYVDRAVKEVERQLAETDKKLKTRVKTPMSLDYRPELDDTPELDAKRANLIGPSFTRERPRQNRPTRQNSTASQ